MEQYLENQIVKLRALEPHDIEMLYQWENDTNIWLISNTFAPFSRHLLKQYIENSHLDIYTSKQLRLIIFAKQLKESVGAIDLFDFDPYHRRAGVGVLVHNIKHRNKGFATNALRLLADYCFNYLNLHQLYCNIASDNHESLQLFQKMGFQIAGQKSDWIFTTNGWKDEYFLQLINKEA